MDWTPLRFDAISSDLELSDVDENNENSSLLTDYDNRFKIRKVFRYISFRWLEYVIDQQPSKHVVLIRSYKVYKDNNSLFLLIHQKLIEASKYKSI